jgi:hypothetical protein
LHELERELLEEAYPWFSFIYYLVQLLVMGF